MEHNMEIQKKKERKTLVWWNISSCPIPLGYDPRQVGPRIVSALKSKCISGPVTVTAVGRLTPAGPNAPDNEVLRELSSSGISLIHAEEFQLDLFCSMEKFPPTPVNIMIICSPTELEGLAHTIYYFIRYGYRIFLAYPQRHPAPAWLWNSFLHNVSKEWLWTRLLTDDVDTWFVEDDKKKQLTTRLVRQEKCSETGESPWFCSLCYFAGQSFEDFTTHLKSEEHARTALASGAPKHNSKMVKLDPLKEEVEKEEVKTLVWWNISTCPIPPGYDPRQVGPRIVSALKNYGVSGPVTVTAIGSLTHSPNAPDNEVLRELSSTGIGLIHSMNDIQTDLFEWMEKNPAPANIMIICGPIELLCLAQSIYDFKREGYRIFLAYPERNPTPDWLWESFLRDIDGEWLWTSLLATDDMETGSADDKTRFVRQDKCSETGESPWFCSICDFAGQSFEDFTTHLRSEEHERSVQDRLPPGSFEHNNSEKVKLDQIKEMSKKKRKLKQRRKTPKKLK